MRRHKHPSFSFSICGIESSVSTTSGSSFGACSSSATFCLLWLRLVFVVDSLGWWLPQRVRWRGAGPRDDVMSAVLVDRGSGHGGGSKGYFLFAMASPCCKSSKSMLILWQRNQTYLSEGVDKGSRIARVWSPCVAMPRRVKCLAFCLSRRELNWWLDKSLN